VSLWCDLRLQGDAFEGADVSSGSLTAASIFGFSSTETVTLSMKQ
jgi:hypothetical protein